jgi:hypothetical protein
MVRRLGEICTVSGLDNRETAISRLMEARPTRRLQIGAAGEIFMSRFQRFAILWALGRAMNQLDPIAGNSRKQVLQAVHAKAFSHQPRELTGNSRIESQCSE